MNVLYKTAVLVRTDRVCMDKTILRKVAEETLRLEGIQNSVEINLLLIDDAQIKKLNNQFLDRNRPTDVIAFGAKKGRPAKNRLKGFIGEIAISAETAQRNAKIFNTTKEKEIFLYIIHGILHLLGYDDENIRGKKIMQKRQAEILKEVCKYLNS